MKLDAVTLAVMNNRLAAIAITASLCMWLTAFAGTKACRGVSIEGAAGLRLKTH